MAAGVYEPDGAVVHDRVQVDARRMSTLRQQQIVVTGCLDPEPWRRARRVSKPLLKLCDRARVPGGAVDSGEPRAESQRMAVGVDEAGKERRAVAIDSHGSTRGLRRLAVADPGNPAVDGQQCARAREARVEREDTRVAKE